MTQPAVPSAAAQQQAAVEVFAQYEPTLYAAYLEMMTGWLAAVKKAMFTGGVATLGLVPDPFAVFSQTPLWQDIVGEYSEQVARDVLSAPYKNLFADDNLFASRPFVRNWIAARENRLSHIPNEVFGLVKHIIDGATTNGASIPDVQAQVEDLFGATGAEKWKGRAKAVARTEVVGAYNGGLHDAFSMIADADPETEWVHRWLSTEDARTRPDHVEADGQVQPWGQPFTVGGFQMMHPHAPDAPAKEVVNCRCIELFEIKNEPTEMGNRQYKGPPSLGADASQVAFFEQAIAEGTIVRQHFTLMQAVCTDGTFCMQTHKPGLCKGQKRGQTEPGAVDETKQTPAQRAQVAVKGLGDALQHAQAVAQASQVSNPKLAAAARRAAAGYAKALSGHQQTLKQAAGANAKAARTGVQDARQQDSIDRKAANVQKREAAKKAAVEKRAQAILDRRKEAAKVAKMTPKQRAAYGKQKSAQAKAKHKAAEQKVLKEAGKG
jgi:hypothetical protein